MNNMIIPIIDKSVNKEPYNNKETGRYLELYIITNVFMSLIYYSNLPLDKTYDVVLTEENKNRLNSKEYDYINFGNDYRELGKLIYDKYYDKKTKKIINEKDTEFYNFIDKTFNSSKVNCNYFINNPVDKDAQSNLEQFIIKFINNDYKKRLIYKIKKLITFFKQNDIKNKIMDDKTNKFFKDNVFFYNNSDAEGKVLLNKFILKKSFFDNLNDTTYTFIFGDYTTEEKKDYINDIVDNYFNILLHYFFNKNILILNKKGIADALKKNENSICTSDDTKYLENHINNFRNLRLFILLLFQKPTIMTTTINIDMDDTFKNIYIEPEKIQLIINNLNTPGQDPMKLNVMYDKLIENAQKEKGNNSIMNRIKNIYYQINKKKIHYDPPYIDNKNIKEYKKINSDIPEIIKNKADNVISYELFITYFINLIIIIIIFNIAIINNNNKIL
jgi:hypothetical protein